MKIFIFQAKGRKLITFVLEIDFSLTPFHVLNKTIITISNAAKCKNVCVQYFNFLVEIELNNELDEIGCILINDGQWTTCSCKINSTKTNLFGRQRKAGVKSVTNILNVSL